MVISTIITASVIALSWYLLVERSARVARDRAAQIAAQLAPGDLITTSDGLLLQVVSVAGDSCVGRTTSGHHIVVSSSSVLDRQAPVAASAGAPAAELLGHEFSATADRWFGPRRPGLAT